MKGKQEKLIKNKPSVILGSVMGLVTILYLTELIQFLLASFISLPTTKLVFGFIYFLAEFGIDSSSPMLLNILVIITPLIVLFTCSQLVAFAVTKAQLGATRYTLMVYQLMLIGYVLFYLFYQAVTIIIDIDSSSDFVKLASLLELEHPYNIFGIFFIIFILAIYININARKISKYINK